MALQMQETLEMNIEKQSDLISPPKSYNVSNSSSERTSSSTCMSIDFTTFFFPKLLVKAVDIPSDEYGFSLPYENFELKDIAHFNRQYAVNTIRRELKWKELLDQYFQQLPPFNCKIKRYMRKGIPSNLRGRCWFFYSGAEKKWLDNKTIYTTILKTIKIEGNKNNVTAEIEKDLNRTFPNNQFFKKTDGKETVIQSALRRVLLAYSFYKPKTQYHQSFSYIVALLLLFVDEEKAFWILDCVIEDIMPKGMYNLGVGEAVVEIDIIVDLLKNKMPKVYQHIINKQDEGMPPVSLAMSHWFLVLFTDLLPIESNLRVWDAFFSEGAKVLFRVALALYKIYENDLLSIKDPLELFQKIQNLPKPALDCRILLETAFSKCCTISKAEVAGHRMEHLACLD